MRLLDQLLDQALAAIPAGHHDRVVVFGSAPMVFAGLKADVTLDLDLFVDSETYQALLAHGFVEDSDERGCPRIMVAAAVEVVRTWPGVTFEGVYAASAPAEGSRGFRLASLEHVLAFKTISPRNKDQREADVVRRALAVRGGRRGR
jgi:hypothetical protein